MPDVCPRWAPAKTFESTVRGLEVVYDALGCPLHELHLRFQCSQLDV